jgi:predicted porin
LEILDMKKSLLALAVLSAFAGAASAQSSVTLSGAVDLGVYRQNGAWNMQNAGSSRTNFNLSGSEDLGGGMSAFFNLNHRFNANTGVQRDANAFWRQSWVGLRGGFGNIRLGKMLPPLQVFNGDFEICDGNGVNAQVCSVHTGGIFSGQTAAGSRYNNAIYYTSPVLAGLTGHAMIAAGDNNSELAGGAGASERPIGLGLNYAAGPIRVAAAYDRNADDKKTVGVYGSFNAGFATLLAQWERGDTYSAAIEDVSRWSVGAKVPFGAATLKLGYTKWSDEDTKKLGIGLDYSLSKRTTLYTDVGKFSGDGVAGTPGAGNNISPTGGTLSDLNRKTRFAVGVFHRF